MAVAQQLQADELEVLQSMYCAPGEYVVTSDDSASGSQFVLTIALGEADSSCTIQLECAFPALYPVDALPQLTVRSSSFSRALFNQVNNQVKSFMETQKGQPCVLAVLEYLRDVVPPLVQAEGQRLKARESKGNSGRASRVAFVREMVWFHHIYSKVKLLRVHGDARAHKLTGVVCPGKPGVLVVEGEEAAVRNYLTDIRRLSWQKMSTRHTHRLLVDEEQQLAAQHKFPEFRVWTAGLGALLEEATELGLGPAMRLTLGLEGTVAEAPDEHEDSDEEPGPPMPSSAQRPAGTGLSESLRNLQLTSSTMPAVPSPAVATAAAGPHDLSCVREEKSGTGASLTVAVLVKPNARSTALVHAGPELGVKLAAAPREGSANEELIEFMAQVLGLKRRQVTLARGDKARNKVLALTGINREQAVAKLSAQLDTDLAEGS